MRTERYCTFFLAPRRTECEREYAGGDRRTILKQLGLQVRDDYRIPLGPPAEKPEVTDRILDALNEAINRCRGPEDSWMVLDLKRAMILIGGLDEEVAKKIPDQEGA